MTNPVQIERVAASRGVTPIEWVDGRVRLLDQSRLPHEVRHVELASAEEAANAIREMRVRGAPAIGVTAAYGMALAAAALDAPRRGETPAAIHAAAQTLAASRPTAVNLRWAIDRMMRAAEQSPPGSDLAAVLLAEARDLHRETLDSDLRLSELGAALIAPGSAALTHCNTGALATGGYGTALGVIRRGWEDGRLRHVFATETRPWLQGARLTTWELASLGIPATLVVDSAAASLMADGRVQCVITGADRIAANGDTANKIGTLSLAALAHHYGVPFYVAAPVTTIDLGAASGADIPIEERPESEVTHTRGAPVAPDGTHAWNPAFDVTPGALLAAIITDGGVARPPYEQSLAEVSSSG